MSRSLQSCWPHARGNMLNEAVHHSRVRSGVDDGSFADAIDFFTVFMKTEEGAPIKRAGRQSGVPGLAEAATREADSACSRRRRSSLDADGKTRFRLMQSFFGDFESSCVRWCF